MIIVTEEYGQLSNRLYALAPFISYAIESKTRFICLSFGCYQGQFPRINSRNDIVFVALQPRLLHLLRRAQLFISRKSIGRFLNCRFFDAWSATALTHTELKKGINLIDPWYHPKPQISSREAEIIRSLFQPCQQVKEEVADWLQSKRQTYCRHVASPPVLAVHARRGDYKSFNGGKWYFSDLEYFRIIQTCVSAIHAQLGIKPVVVACSNEQGFSLGSCVTMSPFDSSAHDQEALAQADFVVGPPSTFSAWASFMGQNKIAFIEEPDKPIVFEDFNAAPPMNHPSLLD